MVEIKKDWTAQEAVAANEEALKENPQTPPNLLPASIWEALHKLDNLEEAFVAGNDMALMLAIRECARVDLAMPDWVARAYISRFDRVNRYRAGSWDEVFGRPLKKGQHLDPQRRKLVFGVEVYNRVREEVNKGASVTPSLFGVIAADMTDDHPDDGPFASTWVSERYYEWKKNWKVMLPGRNGD